MAQQKDSQSDDLSLLGEQQLEPEQETKQQLSCNEPESEAQLLQQRVLDLEKELADAKERMYRAVADSENLRKRLERERQDLLKYGFESVFADLLPALDSFDKALANIGNNEASDGIMAGVEMVYRQLMDTLSKHGLSEINSVGQVFDPSVHQAIQRVSSAEVGPGHVVQQYAKGYMLHERLLRPAMVTVATED